jgi:hypothetical protein
MGWYGRGHSRSRQNDASRFVEAVKDNVVGPFSRSSKADLMIALVLLNVLACVGVVLAVGGLLFLLFRYQLRQYDRAVSTDLLDDWNAQLELLNPADRDRTRLEPPARVLAAMATLPSTLPSTWRRP